MSSFFWLRGLSVTAATGGGDDRSIGDSSPKLRDNCRANRAWPELLAERLQSDPELAQWGVVNVGVSAIGFQARCRRFSDGPVLGGSVDASGGEVGADPGGS